jgi:hypothetical protein
MSNRAASRLGWSAWVVCVALSGFTLTLAILSVGLEPRASGLDGPPSAADAVTAAVYFVAVAAFATVGAFVIWRRPGNAIGWVFLAIGAVVSVRVLAAQYAEYSLLVRPGSLPGGRVAVSLGEAVSPLMFALLGLALLLFPDGRPPSRRWRKLLWILGAAALFGVVGLGLRPGHFAETEAFDTFSNPLGVGSDPEPFDALGGLSWLLVTSGMFACGVAMVRRMRRAHGIERLQLKWIAFAASLFAVGFLVISITFFVELSGSIIDPLRTAILGVGFCTIPIAAGIAILRYRLYDIDVVINRTLVYGALTATLAGVYVGSVLLLQLVLSGVTKDSGLAVAASTLAVAALFRPARTRIQGAVDRRFFRRKYDAARTLERFGSHLRDEVALDSLSAELRAVVFETMQPAHVSLWLRR